MYLIVKMNIYYFFIAFLLNQTIEACTFYKKESKINLLNNGYENILIVINNDVAENFEIIERIRSLFTEASSLLFNVTRKRAYFKEISILIPTTWKLNYFNKKQILYSSWEKNDNGDICIEKRDELLSSTPFVINYAGDCGESALHIHLSTDYLMKENKSLHQYGSFKNVLIRQWAQFRYGVFEEGSLNSKDEGDFYYNSNGEIDANRCTSNRSGKLRDAFSHDGKCKTFLPNGLPDSSCIFEDDVFENESGIQFGSLMYKSFLPQINTFCDDDPSNLNINHNSFASNFQNKICKGKSVWEVMNGHDDFNNGKNMPAFNQISTAPVFKVIKQFQKRVVLIIDRSLIFDSPNTHLVIKRALEDFVFLMLKNGEIISVIHFDLKSNIVLEFTEYSEKTLHLIHDKAIPVGGQTNKSNLWSALRLAIKLVKNSKNYPQDGANFILLTNAIVDLAYPNRKEVYEMLKLHQIKVDTIAFSSQADFNLELIAAHTNGLSFRLSDTYRTFDLTSALNQIANRDTETSKQFVIIHNEFETIQPQSTITSQVFIDDEASHRKHSVTRFQFEFDYLQSVANIKLIEPFTNRTFSLHETDNCEQKYLKIDDNDKISGEVVCMFNNPAYGLWTVIFTNPYFEPLTHHFTVVSYFDRQKITNILNTNNNNNPITKVEAAWKHSILSYPSMQALYVSISKLSKPILNATVRAIIMRPIGAPLILDLFDDGLFSDRFKNDGIYSRYFLSYNSNGPYTAHIVVTTTDQTTIHPKKIAGTQSVRLIHPTLKIYNTLNEASFEQIHSFERSLTIGSFLLHDYIENHDFISPGRINDLKVEAINLKDLIFQLSFTSPGDDGDIGTSARYEIKIMTNPVALLYEENDEYKKPKNFQIPNGNNLNFEIISDSTPSEYGNKEKIRCKVNKVEIDLLSIKIRAVDEHDNKGEWSSVVIIKLRDTNMKLAGGIRNYERTLEHKNLALIEPYDPNYVLKREKKILISLVLIVVAMIIIVIVFSIIYKFLNVEEETDPELIERI